MLLEHFLETLQFRCVGDEPVKRAVFLTAVSAYSEDPLNIILKGPSSVGKTFVTMQVMRFFPKDDVWLLAAMSPTSLAHERGRLIDAVTGEEIDPLVDKPRKSDFTKDNGGVDEQGYFDAMRAWNETLKGSYCLVDLSNKILVFLDSPSYELFQRLKPILSHDASEISYKFADKTKSGLRTQHVKVRGWPATVFCCADEAYLEEISTRSVTLSPEMSNPKYQAVVELQGRRASYPWEFEEREEEKRLREMLTVRIMLLRVVKKVVIPFAERLSRYCQVTMPRHMRDHDHFQAMIMANALSNIFERPILKRGNSHYVIAVEEDLEAAKSVFEDAYETTVTGLGRQVLDFYEVVIKEFGKPENKDLSGLTYEQGTKLYNEKYGRRTSKKATTKWTERLREVGLLDTVEDPVDRRRKLIVALQNRPNWIYLEKDEFAEIFTPEDLESWLNQVLKINPPEAMIYNNWQEKKPISRDELRTVLCTPPFEGIISKGQSGLESKVSEPMGQENLEFSKNLQLRRIPESALSVSSVSKGFLGSLCLRDVEEGMEDSLREVRIVLTVLQDSDHSLKGFLRSEPS